MVIIFVELPRRITNAAFAFYITETRDFINLFGDQAWDTIAEFESALWDNYNDKDEDYIIAIADKFRATYPEWLER